VANSFLQSRYTGRALRIESLQHSFPYLLGSEFPFDTVLSGFWGGGYPSTQVCQGCAEEVTLWHSFVLVVRNWEDVRLLHRFLRLVRREFHFYAVFSGCWEISPLLQNFLGVVRLLYSRISWMLRRELSLYTVFPRCEEILDSFLYCWWRISPPTQFYPGWRGGSSTSTQLSLCDGK
jgi:hypothetical protein